MSYLNRKSFIQVMDAIWAKRGLVNHGIKQHQQWGSMFDAATGGTGWTFLPIAVGEGKSTMAQVLSVLSSDRVAVFTKTKADARKFVEECSEIQSICTEVGVEFDQTRTFTDLNSAHDGWKDREDRRTLARESEVLVLSHAIMTMAMRDSSKLIWKDLDLEGRYKILDERVSFTATFDVEAVNFRALKKCFDEMPEDTKKYLVLEDETGENLRMLDAELDVLDELVDHADRHKPRQILEWTPSVDVIGSFPRTLVSAVESPAWHAYMSSRVGARDMGNLVHQIQEHHAESLATAEVIIKNQSVVLSVKDRRDGTNYNQALPVCSFIPSWWDQCLVLDATARVDGMYEGDFFPGGQTIAEITDMEGNDLSRLRDYSKVTFKLLDGARNAIDPLTDDVHQAYWIDVLNGHFRRQETSTLAFMVKTVWESYSAPLGAKGWNVVNNRLVSPCGKVKLAQYGYDSRGVNDLLEAEDVVLIGSYSLPDYLYMQEAVLRAAALDNEFLSSGDFTRAWNDCKFALWVSDILQAGARGAMRVGGETRIWITMGHQEVKMRHLEETLRKQAGIEWPGCSFENLHITKDPFNTTAGAPTNANAWQRIQDQYDPFLKMLSGLTTGRHEFSAGQIAEQWGISGRAVNNALKHLDRDGKHRRIWGKNCPKYLVTRHGAGRSARWVVDVRSAA